MSLKILKLLLALLCIGSLFDDIRAQIAQMEINPIKLPYETKKRTTFNCFNYKWLPKLKKFVAKRKIRMVGEKECDREIAIRFIEGGKTPRLAAIPDFNKVWKRCNMPAPGATNLTYLNFHGCGPCAPGTNGTGCVECEGSKCNALKPIKCFQGVNMAAASVATSCASSLDSVCAAPIYQYSEKKVSDHMFKCGPCAEGTKGISCRECTGGPRVGCNAPDNVIRNYRCVKYIFNETTGNPVKNGTLNCTGPLTESWGTCNRPSYTIDPYLGENPLTPNTTTYTNTDQCGPCKEDDTACRSCEGDLCNKIPIKCHQTLFGPSKATECVDRKATKCFAPKFTSYLGFAKGVQYGCGKCEKSKDCVECTGKYDKGCNAVPTLGDDYFCFQYEYDDRVFRRHFISAEVRCLRLPGEEAICNMPASAEARDNYDFSSCGPCPGSSKNDSFCAECEGEWCNTLTWSLSAAGRVPATGGLALLLALMISFQ